MSDHRHVIFLDLLQVTNILSRFIFPLLISLSVGNSDVFAQPIPDVAGYDAVYPGLPVEDVIRQAVAGNVLAQHELSSRFARGNGVPSSQAAAARWYSLATSRGFPGSPSLDGIGNYPILARSASSGNLDNPPSAQLALTPDGETMTATLDASASSAASAIIRYVWFIESADGNNISTQPGNVQMTQVSLPATGLYYVTLAVLDDVGRIGHRTEILDLSPPPDPVPMSPVPINPLPDDRLEQNTLEDFSWNTSDTANLYSLEIVDTQNPGTSLLSAFVPAANCTIDTCQLSIDLNLPIGQTYAWQVRAENATGISDWSITPIQIIPEATQIPPAPTLLSPVTSSLISQNDVIDFTWTQNPHAVTWEFQFIDAVTPENLPLLANLRPHEMCSETQCLLSLPVGLPVGENHLWRVRGRNSLGTSNWSQTMFDVIETVSGIPGVFSLTSPAANEEILENTETTFTWTRATQATTFELALIDGTDPAAPLTIITINAGTCGVSSCNHTTTPTLPVSDLHSWQVRAVNTLGETAWVSAPFSIIAEPPEPAPAPIIIAPLAGTSVVTGQSAVFQWQQDSNVLSYEFYLNDADNGPQTVVTDLLPGTHCVNQVCSYTHLVALTPGTLHSWHVRARYDLNDSEWSNTLLTVVPDTTEPGVYVVQSTNVSGGGFQSDVTISDDALTVYSSGDVSGIFKSSDGGLLFESRNEGLESTKIASLAITPDNDQILYAGTGDKGISGGLFRSVDGGETWEVTGDGANARFAGNHTASGDPLPSGHPRSNGDLITIQPGANPATHTDDIVIAGSYNDGVRLFSQGGETEASAVNTGGFVRSVAHNPALPDIAFAAIQFTDDTINGIYRIDYSDLLNPISTLEFPALRPEGLTVLSNGHVYAAVGTDGIAKFDGNSWVLQNSQLSIGNPNRQWSAVDGYVSGTEDIVYAGTNNQGGTATGDDYSNIWRTVDGGDTWSPLVDAATNVSDTIHGKTYDWWYRVDAFAQGGLGRKNSIVSSVHVASGSSPTQVSDDIIYVSGRGGIWKSDNGGGSWAPAVYNMQSTSNFGVAVNPNDPDQLVLANTDYVALETRTHFQGSDMSRDKPSGSESRAYDAIFDTVSDEIILGVGDRDTNDPGGGEVFVKSATTLGAPAGSGWTNTDLSSVTAANNGRVRAVSFGYHDGTSATPQTILAAVEGEGVFRYQSGSWTQSTGITIGATDRSNFVWPDNGNSGTVYLIDLSEGLYRSSDGGQSWVDIWPSMSFKNNDFYNTGYIAASDNAPGTVYVSIQGNNGSPINTSFKVYRMVGADAGVFGDPGTTGITDISNHSGGALIKRPGPLVFGPNGKLWLTEQQDSKNSVDAGLFFMENPVTDTSFTEVTENDYRNAAVSPSGIDVSGDGFIYVSQNGGGVVKIAIPTP